MEKLSNKEISTILIKRIDELEGISSRYKQMGLPKNKVEFINSLLDLNRRVLEIFSTRY